MAKKRANVFEQYVDKLVLGLAGVVSVGLLWMFIVAGPYRVEYAGQKLGPGRLDSTIQTKAQRLQARLDEPPVPAPPYEPQLPRVLAKIQDPLGPVVADLIIPLPGIGEKAVIEQRQYRLPEMPALAAVDVQAIRTVAYVPIEPLDQSTPYDKAPVDLGDVDYVTVQASLDVASLYRGFRQSFNSPMLRHPDPELAQPVFATVDLERRRLQDDGSWGAWTLVPPPRNNHLARFLTVPTDPENPLEIELKMRQFRQFESTRQILQPTPYDFASPHEAWLVPTLYEKYTTLLRREREMKLREERERELDQLRRDRDTRTSTRPTTTRPTGRTTRGVDDRQAMRDTARGRTGPGGLTGRREDLAMREQYGYEGPGGVGRPGVPGARQEEKPDDVLADMAKLMLQPNENLAERKDPLVIWAHDDSIDEPGTYQYRMRLGVFNPIVGKNWVAPSQSELDKQVVLYTPYTDPTEPIGISARTYFFPTNVVADAMDAVQVDVARYHLGRWRTNEFTVHCGEPIGREVEVQPERPTAAGGFDGRERLMTPEYPGLDRYGGTGGAPTGPQKIDFSTDAVLVDVVTSTTWLTAGTALSRRDLREILYARNEGDMDRFPVTNRNWPAPVRSLYEEIKQSEQQGPIQYVARTHYRNKLDSALRQQRMPLEMDPRGREMIRGGGFPGQF